jgi:hypothetical protein
METVADVTITTYESKNFCKDNRRDCASFSRHVSETEGCTVRRVFYEENLDVFRENKAVWSLICDAGTEILPVSVADGKIVKIEDYPGKRELLEDVRIQIERRLKINEII